MQLASLKRCSGITTPSHSDRRVPARPQQSKPKRHSTLARAANTEDLRGKHDEDYIWTHMAFPSYLQSREKHRKDVCRDFDRAVTAAERKQLRTSGEPDSDSSPQGYWDDEEAEQSVWLSIRREAERDAAAEPLLSSFLYATILAHDSFERALAFVLSNRLANAVMLPTQLFETFYAVLTSDPDVREGALADVEACRERDPACTSYSQALLYYKGFHAIQTHRIAHALWNRGQRVMAVALQSRMSEVLAVDIHPAARLGRGILLDHGTGVVIGETAVIGNNVSLLQNVTLGGTGKQHGDRHPKISDNVLIGASATVLGNIRVGEGAQIAAGSLVLKPVEPHTMVAGSPAKPVGTVTGNPAEKMQQWSKKLNYDPFANEQQQQQQQQQPAAAVAAAAATAAEQQPPRAASPVGKASVAESEAAWDAVAAKTAAEEDQQAPPASASGSSSQPQQLPLSPATQQLAANGTSHPAAGGNGSKAPAAAAAAAAAAAGGGAGGAHHDQPRWQQSDAQQYMYEQITGHGHQQQHQQQQQQQQQPQQLPEQPQKEAAQQPQHEPPAIQGVHGGEVDATIDEAVAAVKWSDRKEEPEYVI